MQKLHPAMEVDITAAIFSLDPEVEADTEGTA